MMQFSLLYLRSDSTAVPLAARNNFLSPYAICIIRLSFGPIFRQKISAENRKSRQHVYSSKWSEIKILLSKRPYALTIKSQNIGALTKIFCKQMFNFDTLDSDK